MKRFCYINNILRCARYDCFIQGELLLIIGKCTRKKVNHTIWIYSQGAESLSDTDESFSPYFDWKLLKKSKEKSRKTPKNKDFRLKNNNGTDIIRPVTLVGVTGLEPAASKSQTSRATNCATPRFLFDFLLILRRSGTNCGQTRFLRFFEIL